MTESSLQEALGEAFGEMFLFDKAVEYYRLALENRNCGASIRAIEQMANFSIRLAVTNFEADHNHYETSEAVIRDQIERLQELMKMVCPSLERLSLIGSGHKRLAQISSEAAPQVCYDALVDMEKAYQQAWDMQTERLYPLLRHRVGARRRL